MEEAELKFNLNDPNVLYVQVAFNFKDSWNVISLPNLKGHVVSLFCFTRDGLKMHALLIKETYVLSCFTKPTLGHGWILQRGWHRLGGLGAFVEDQNDWRILDPRFFLQMIQPLTAHCVHRTARSSSYVGRTLRS